MIPQKLDKFHKPFSHNEIGGLWLSITVVVTKIKDTWRAGKVASALFLDIQVAFSNTVKERLLHNMWSRCVPDKYIQLFNNMLTNCGTRLQFNNYLSDPIHISNGMTQGCPLLMLLYAFYNTDLIDIAKGKCELSTDFINDCAFIAIADTLDNSHGILKNMMERTNGGLTGPTPTIHPSKYQN